MYPPLRTSLLVAMHDDIENMSVRMKQLLHFYILLDFRKTRLISNPGIELHKFDVRPIENKLSLILS